MSTAENNELAAVLDVLDRLKDWSAPSKITLARRILETLESSTAGQSHRVERLQDPTRGVPVEKVLGILRTDGEPPGDDECRRIVEEELWKKYGS